MITRLLMIAIAPGIALGAAVYLNDRYDREPWYLLIKTFILGALSVIPVIVIERLLLRINIFSGLLGIAYTAFVVAGLTEEYFKRAAVVHGGAFNSRYFNEKLDGIVYCVFSALGFATVENIMYVVFRYTSNYYVGIMRGILSVPAHVLFAVTMGYYLSLAKYAKDPSVRQRYYGRSLLIPIVLHGLFNFILMARIPILMALFIPYVAFLWIMNIRKLNEYTRDSRDVYHRSSALREHIEGKREDK